MIHFLRFTLVILFIAAISSCRSMSGSGDYTFSEKSRRIKLNVGEIKEIALKSRRDSTWQMIGASENKEIVDVTSKEDPSEETTTTTIPHNGSMVFLVKGVTNGRVKITFAEKQKSEAGSGRILKTYLVDVVTK